MIGKTLGRYKIIEQLGKGGMGEVYLADDTTLDRKVALKFIPDAFTSDPERMARFEREAKLLASLNHPNIAGIYGLEQADGNRFLVLEYVEGETLQARLSKGALPLEDALLLCRQIAEGLEAAHEKGVIHRDLKPANVMITAEEKVKILDFGLAKALSDEIQSIDSSQSPTLTEAMTQLNNSYAISPDGNWIVYVAASSESKQSLFVCETGTITSRKLDGTEGAKLPFWSPDSKFIGFFTRDKLRRVEVTGGSPMDICDVSDAPDNGTWNNEGVIIYSDIPVLRSVSEEGGEPVTIIGHEEFPDTVGYGSPYFLPDGRRYLFAAWHPTIKKNGIYLGSLDSAEKIRIKDYSSEAVYAEPGYLLFQREGRLFAQAFDTKQQKLMGKEVSIADNLVVESGLSYLSVSTNGLLVYRSAENQAQSQFTWFDRTGTVLGKADRPVGNRKMWDLSRDGTKIILVQDDPVTLQPEIWQFEWKRDTLNPVTFKETAALWPVWSPDGDRFGYTLSMPGSYDIFEKKIGDPGEGNPVINSPNDEMIRDWSKDGRYIAYTFSDGSSMDLYILPLFGDRKPWPIVQRPFYQEDPEFSYNGKWLAYSSNESGTWQIYVIRMAAEEQPRHQISTEGGTQPQWKGDDKEIFGSSGKSVGTKV